MARPKDGVYNPEKWERNWIHPQAARWLGENGYVYEHELVLGGTAGYGNGGTKRIDFVGVWVVNWRVLILECKRYFFDKGAVSRAIKQVKRYRERLGCPDAEVGLFTVRTEVFERKGEMVTEVCRENGVRLVVVDDERCGFPESGCVDIRKWLPVDLEDALIRSKFELIQEDKGKPMRQILMECFKKHDSQQAVAEELGVTQGTISLWLVKLGLKTKTILIEEHK